MCCNCIELKQPGMAGDIQNLECFDVILDQHVQSKGRIFSLVRQMGAIIFRMEGMKSRKVFKAD